jgi:hypothetical protein
MKNLESDKLRIEMIMRGLSTAEMAKMVGTIRQRILNVLSFSDRTWPIRARINRTLKKRIFSRQPHRTPGPTSHKTKD